MSQTVDRKATQGWGSTPSQRHFVSHEQALKILEAGVKRAKEINVPQNIAILDPSAWLVGFVRMDNAFLGSIDIAQKKAKTTVFYNGIPSEALKERSQPGGDIFAIEQTNGGTVVFGGGLPIYDNEGYFIGAVGVSGGTVAEDIDVAKAAVEGSGVGKTS